MARDLNISDAQMSVETKRAISRVARRSHSRRKEIEKPGPVTIYDMRTEEMLATDARKKIAEQAGT